MKTLARLLQAAAGEAPTAIAVISEREQLSYVDAAREVARLGGELQAAGLQSGQNVVVVTTLEVPSVIVLAAVSWTGATILPVSAGDAQRHLHQFVPCHLIGPAEHVEALAGECRVGFRVGGKTFVLAHWDRPASGEIRAEDEIVFPTSGSTGEPLGVVCRQDQVAFARAAIQERLRYAAGDRVLLGGSLSFDYHYYQVLLTFAVRATLVLCEQVSNPLAAAEATIRQKVTVLPLIPYAFRLLLRSRLLDRADYSGVRLLSATGEVWPATEIQALAEAFPNAAFFPMYGLTECKRVSILDLRAHPGLLGSVGFPLGGTRVRIVNGDEAGQAHGKIGEIAVSGPHLARGYLGRPEATARRFRQLPDGGRVLLTGDSGYLDEQGALWFVGRDAQIIKHRGLRVAAATIESALLACPDVQRAVVINVFTATGEKVAAMIELVGDGSQPTARMEDAARRSWPLAGQPDLVEFGPIPLLPNGKPARPQVAAFLHERCRHLP